MKSTIGNNIPKFVLQLLWTINRQPKEDDGKDDSRFLFELH